MSAHDAGPLYESDLAFAWFLAKTEAARKPRPLRLPDTENSLRQYDAETTQLEQFLHGQLRAASVASLMSGAGRGRDITATRMADARKEHA